MACMESQTTMREKEEFGKRLGLAIEGNKKLSGKSVRYIASKLGVSPGFVSHMMNGARMPATDTGVRIAKALDVAFEWLMTGRGPMFVAKADLPLDKLNDRDRKAVEALIKSLEEE